MKRFNAMVWLVLMAGVATLATGCESMPDCSFTSHVWNDWSAQHYQPAPQPEVKMFTQRGNEDVLVVYLEQREKTGATKRRAYVLPAREGWVLERAKPHFVDVKSAVGLAEISVESSGKISFAPVWAELNPEQNGFRLFHNGVATDWLNLPVYRDRLDQTEQLLLVPVAVTGDAAVVGAVVGVFAVYIYAGAYAPYSEPADRSFFDGHR